jgi:hypothetical protein
VDYTPLNEYGELGVLSGLVVFIGLGVLGTVALCATRSHRRALPFQVKLFWGALTLRYLMSLVIYLGGLVNVLKDEDGSGWLLGVEHARGWTNQGLGLFDLLAVIIDGYPHRHRGYYYLLGALFYLTEPARLPAAALNCFFGAMMVVYAYRIAETLFSPWVARRVGLWLCLFPSMVMWSAQTIKEPVIIFLEVLAVYGCVRMRRSGFSVFHLGVCLLCILLMISFRFYAAYVTTLAIVVASVVPRAGRGRFRFGPAIGALALAGSLVSSGLLAGRERETEQFDLKYIEAFRKNAAVGGSGVEIDVDISTPGGMGLALVVGAAHLLLAPFPWQLVGGSLRMLMVAPEMLFWWWVFFRGVVPGMALTVRTRFREVLPLLIMLAGFGILYSLMFSNVGLVYRQRAQLLPWLLIFGAVGLEQRHLRRLSRKRRGSAMTGSFVRPGAAPAFGSPRPFESGPWPLVDTDDVRPGAPAAERSPRDVRGLGPGVALPPPSGAKGGTEPHDQGGG